MNTSDKLTAANKILRSAGISRAWRFAEGIPGELVILIDREEFDNSNVEALEREIVAALGWKVWLTYWRESSVEIVKMF